MDPVSALLATVLTNTVFKIKDSIKEQPSHSTNDVYLEFWKGILGSFKFKYFDQHILRGRFAAVIVCITIMFAFDILVLVLLWGDHSFFEDILLTILYIFVVLPFGFIPALSILKIVETLMIKNRWALNPLYIEFESVYDKSKLVRDYLIWVDNKQKGDFYDIYFERFGTPIKETRTTSTDYSPIYVREWNDGICSFTIKCYVSNQWEVVCPLHMI